MKLAIETTHLVRDFGSFRAVYELDLRVEEGKFYGFLGPNGAGKSTTLKMLTGLLTPTKSPIRIMLVHFFRLFAVQFAMAPLVLPALAEFLLRSYTTTQLPINFLLSAVLATLMSYVYWLSLQPLGRLLEQRGIRILFAVTAEVE